MILKHMDGRDRDLATLEDMLGRAGPKLRERIGSEIGRIRTGLKGEADAAFHIDEALSDSTRSFVMHDLRIEHRGKTAQIDHLVIHRTYRFAMVVETKNFDADLSWNEHGEWTARYGRRSWPVESPIEQARRHCRMLEKWIADVGLPAMRSYVPLVMISTRSRLPHGPRVEDGVEIVKADMFNRRYDQRMEAMGTGGVLMGLFGGLDQQTVENLCEALSRAHSPAEYDWDARVRSWQREIGPRGSHLEDPHPVLALEPPAPPAGGPAPVAPARSEPAVDSVRRHVSRIAERLPDGDPVKSTLVSTRHGDVVIRRYADETRSVRCQDRGAKDALVAECRRVGAKWHHPSRSWLMPLDACRSVVSAMGGSERVAPDPSAFDGDQSPPKAREAAAMPPSGPPPGPIPDAIATRRGEVRIVRIGTGMVALRHPKDEALAQDVADACREAGRWQPRYGNWLVADRSLPDVIARLST